MREKLERIFLGQVVISFASICRKLDTSAFVNRWLNP